MKKRLLSALLALSVLLGSMPVYALEDTTPATPDPATVSTTETAADAAAAQAVEQPFRPKDSEGGDVCRGTVRVPLRVQSNPNLQLFEVANS